MNGFKYIDQCFQTVSSFFLPVAAGGSGIRKTRARFEELWNQLAKDERSSIQWGVGAKEVVFFL
jgi:hypothetical protein